MMEYVVVTARSSNDMLTEMLASERPMRPCPSKGFVHIRRGSWQAELGFVDYGIFKECA